MDNSVSNKLNLKVIIPIIIIALIIGLCILKHVNSTDYVVNKYQEYLKQDAETYLGTSNDSQYRYIGRSDQGEYIMEIFNNESYCIIAYDKKTHSSRETSEQDIICMPNGFTAPYNMEEALDTIIDGKLDYKWIGNLDHTVIYDFLGVDCSKSGEDGIFIPLYVYYVYYAGDQNIGQVIGISPAKRHFTGYFNDFNIDVLGEYSINKTENVRKIATELYKNITDEYENMDALYDKYNECSTEAQKDDLLNGMTGKKVHWSGSIMEINKTLLIGEYEVFVKTDRGTTCVVNFSDYDGLKEDILNLNVGDKISFTANFIGRGIAYDYKVNHAVLD